MSQVKKLQQGTGQSGVQPAVTPKLKLQINGQDYEQDPQVLQDMFNPVFEQMKANGVAKERNRDDFFKTFQQFQKQASTGTYNLQSSDGKYLTSTYAGADGANLGLNPDGTTAHKSQVGNLISPFTRDEHQRMSMLNTYIGDHLIQKHTADDATAKTKADTDLAKKNADALGLRNEYVGKFSQYQNPATAIYGNTDGADANWAHGKYWEGKGQTSVLQGTFGKIGAYLNDKQLDDAEAQKAFKDKYGLSVADARASFNKRGFANGQFTNPLAVNDLVGLAGDLQMRRSYDPYFNRSKPDLNPEEKAKVDATKAADDAKVMTDGTGFVNATDKLLYADKAFKHPFSGTYKGDGLIYQNGKIFHGLLPSEDENDYYESKPGDYSNSPYIDHGKRTAHDLFWNSTKQGVANKTIEPTVLQNAQAVQKSIEDKLADYHSKFVDLTKTFSENNTSDHYAFKKEMTAGKPVTNAQSWTEEFPQLMKSGERLYAYQVAGKTNVGTDGLTRFKHISPHGVETTGLIKKDIDGTYYLQRADGKRLLLGNRQKPTMTLDDPFYRQVSDDDTNRWSQTGSNMARAFSHKDGGVVSHQFGGLVTPVSNQTAKFKSADINNQVIGDFKGLSTADEVQLGGIASQIGSVVAGFVPGGSIASLGLGIGGTAAEFTANRMKHGSEGLGGDLLIAGGGLLLDAASAIPGLGEIGAMAKLSKYVKGSAKILQAGFAAHGALAATGSLSKLLGDEHMTVDDWRNIAGGIQGIVAGKRLTDPYIATTKNLQNTIKIGGQDVEITPAQASAIQNAKPGARENVAKDLLKDSGHDLDKMDLSDLTTKSFLNKYTLGKFGTKEVIPVPKIALQSNGRKLIDYENANWYQKQAVHNTVAQQPSIAGSKDFTIGSGQNAKPASEGSNLNWIANSYKMKYSPGAGTLPPPVQLGTRLLPTSTGQVGGGKLQRTNEGALIMGEEQPLGRPGAIVDNVSPYSKMSPVYESLQKLDANNDASVDNVINKINLAPKESGSTTSAVNNEHGISEMKKSLGIADGQKIRRDVVKNLFKDDHQLTPEQRYAKNNFLNTHFGKGSVGEALQAKIIDSYTNPRTKGFVKFKTGGLIPKLQLGNQINYNGNVPLDSAFMGPNGIWRAFKTSAYTKSPAILSGRSTMDDILPSVTDQITKSLANGTYKPTAPADAQLAPLAPRSKGGANYGNKGPQLGNIIPQNINPVSVSELGRALYTRQVNSQIDTRVERPMLSAPTEVPVAVKGNLYATRVAGDQANAVTQAAGNLNTSDGKLRAAALLDAYGKAGQMKMQGEMQNIDMLNKTGDMAQQQQMQAAQARSQVSNENTQTLARATQAERAANNEKLGRMAQPVIDFWKDQNYQANLTRQQDRMYDTELGLQSKQNEFSQLTRPMQYQLNNIQWKKMQLESKAQIGQSLSAEDQAQYDLLTKQENDLNNDYINKQNRFGTLSLLTRKNHGNYATPENYYNIGAVPFKASGGTVSNATRLKIQESKDNQDNAEATAKIQQLSIKADADNETKENIEDSKQIQQLIMKALS